MNILVKIINSMIISINRIIDGVDRKTVDSIKQVYYFLLIVIVAGGIFLGYNSGKKNAKKGGEPTVRETDDVFDIIIKTQKEKVSFGTLADGKSIMEKEEAAFRKTAFPSREKIESELNDTIIEPVTDLKMIQGRPLSDNREGIADVNRLDEPLQQEEIKELKRRPLDDSIDQKSEVLKNKNEDFLINEGSGEEKTPSAPGQKPKPIIRDRYDLRPIDKNSGVLEK